jgi:hypothetical protein
MVSECYLSITDATHALYRRISTRTVFAPTPLFAYGPYLQWLMAPGSDAHIRSTFYHCSIHMVGIKSFSRHRHGSSTFSSTEHTFVELATTARRSRSSTSFIDSSCVPLHSNRSCDPSYFNTPLRGSANRETRWLAPCECSYLPTTTSPPQSIVKSRPCANCKKVTVAGQRAMYMLMVVPLCVSVAEGCLLHLRYLPFVPGQLNVM